MPLLVEDKQLVTPGETIAEGDFTPGENAYREGDKIFATKVGLVLVKDKRVDVVALKGFYIPSVGDLVIGKVTDIELNGWLVNINSPYTAIMFASEAFERPFNPRRDELTSILDVGDVLLAKVLAFDRTRDPVITIRGPKLGKISHGHIFRINPVKIPRLIGRKGSMIDMIERETGANIVVGQNGLILVSAKSQEDESLAILAINTVEREAHTTGLTDRISELIQKSKTKGGEQVVDRGSSEKALQ